MESAEMKTAFDHVAFQHAVGEACRRVGAFVVSDIERAVDVVDRERLVAQGADSKNGNRCSFGVASCNVYSCADPGRGSFLRGDWSSLRPTAVLRSLKLRKR